MHRAVTSTASRLIVICSLSLHQRWDYSADRVGHGRLGSPGETPAGSGVRVVFMTIASNV
jgi:hypothetical protein